MEEVINKINPLELFSDEPDIAYEAGAASELVIRRNRGVGSLLNSEHSCYYIQILYRMLLFRREHELEPLNEDLYQAVRPAQESFDGSHYGQDLFTRHIHQLLEWKLVTERLEKERLRGYRDMRRDRYRYRLEDETVAFLHWLEERLHSDFEDASDDAGDLLEFVLSRLREASRALSRFEPDGPDEDKVSRKAANIVFLLYNVNEYTGRISRHLSEINAALGAFLLHNYRVDEARQIIDELRSYMSGYLRRIHELRKKIISEFEKIDSGENADKLAQCFTIHERELKDAPRFLRRGRSTTSPRRLMEQLPECYRPQGRIDSLCHRVNDSAMKVWGKLSAHLRELERKNNRLEGINARLLEIAALPENACPDEFMRELIAAAGMPMDPNYWDEFTKANPPRPRREFTKEQKTIRSYLKRKRGESKPVQSMEETRLEDLKHWVENKFGAELSEQGVEVSKANYSGSDDFKKIIELTRRGILGNGRQLKKIHYNMETPLDYMITVEDDTRSLQFKEMILKSTVHSPQSTARSDEAGATK
jgi:Protein of unknown function (DUF2397)